jgi:predicted amidohydrolase
MNVALVSMRPKVADKQSNIKAITEFTKHTQANMYIFGEMTLSGYSCKDELRDLAEPIEGEAITKLKKVARKTNAYLVFGMPLTDSHITGIIHNAAILIHPDGTVDSYEKWFLPTFGPFEEKLYYDEGEHLPVFTTKFGRLGLLICYDLFFPEISKAYALQGADFLVCISATPSVNRRFFETLLPARAIENTLFVLYSNIVGTQENLVFWGGSQAYDPFGKQLVKTPYFEESCVSCTLDMDALKLARANRPVLRDIRSEIYQDLYTFSRRKSKRQKGKE